MPKYFLAVLIGLASFSIAGSVLAACPAPAQCKTSNFCIGTNGSIVPGASCPNQGDVCCSFTQLTACSGAVTNAPCPETLNITEVPDGPNATCPKNFVNAGCSSKPKSGTGLVLCCQNPVSGTASQCGPQAGVQGFNYQCLRPEGCTAQKGDVIKDIKSPDISCSQSEEVCCRFAVRTGTTTAAPAAKKVTPTSYTLSNPLGTTSIPVIIGRIIKMFLGIVGAIALLVFVYGGVAWMTARGDAGQVKHAQQAIQGAVLGLVIISGSYLFADSFIKALTEMQITSSTNVGGGTSATEATQATTEQTTLEQQQAAAAAAAKAKAGSGGAVCVGDQNAAKACKSDCALFCTSQLQAAGLSDNTGHPCTNLGQSGCPTDQVCCSWKK